MLYLRDAVGIGIVLLAFGATASIAVNGCGCNKKGSLEEQIELQRLETIERLTEQYGDSMSPEQFSEYLEGLNLDK